MQRQLLSTSVHIFHIWYNKQPCDTHIPMSSFKWENGLSDIEMDFSNEYWSTEAYLEIKEQIPKLSWNPKLTQTLYQDNCNN